MHMGEQIWGENRELVWITLAWRCPLDFGVDMLVGSWERVWSSGEEPRPEIEG